MTGGDQVRIARDAAEPQFGSGSDRVFMIASERGKAQLISTDLSGEGRRVHASGDLVNDFQVSPDGRFLAFRQNYQAFVMPLLPGPTELSVDPKGGPLPVVRLSGDGADFIHWSNEGLKLHWSLGPTLFSADAETVFLAAPAGENTSAFKAPAQGVSLSMEVAADKVAGDVALVGARIVTMADKAGGIIDDGVILVRGDRIAAIGPRA